MGGNSSSEEKKSSASSSAVGSSSSMLSPSNSLIYGEGTTLLQKSKRLFSEKPTIEIKPTKMNFVRELEYSQDGKKMVTFVHAHNEFDIWDLSTSKRINKDNHLVCTQLRTIYACRFNPSATLLVISGDGGRKGQENYIYLASDPFCAIAELDGHTQLSYDADFPLEDICIVSGYDKKIIFYNVSFAVETYPALLDESSSSSSSSAQEKQQQQLIPGHKIHTIDFPVGYPYSCQLSRDDQLRWLIICSCSAQTGEGCVEIWERSKEWALSHLNPTTEEDFFKSYKKKGGTILCPKLKQYAHRISYARSTDYCVVGSGSNHFAVIDVANAQLLTVVTTPDPARVLRACFLASGYIISLGEKHYVPLAGQSEPPQGNIRIWRKRNSKPKASSSSYSVEYEECAQVNIDCLQAIDTFNSEVCIGTRDAKLMFYTFDRFHLARCAFLVEHKGKGRIPTLFSHEYVPFRTVVKMITG